MQFPKVYAVLRLGARAAKASRAVRLSEEPSAEWSPPDRRVFVRYSCEDTLEVYLYIARGLRKLHLRRANACLIGSAKVDIDMTMEDCAPRVVQVPITRGDERVGGIVVHYELSEAKPRRRR